jgi:hypothetical protein
MQGSGTRPLAVGDVLDVAMKVYRHNVRLLFRIAGTAYIPALVVFPLALDITGRQAPLGDWISGERTMRTAAVALLAVALTVGSLWAAAGCTEALSQIYLGRSAEPREALVAALRRVPTLLVAALAAGVAVAVAAFALIVPGIWLFGLWLVIVPAVVIERRGPFAALNRSRQLVTGRWWGVVVATLVCAIAVWLVNEVISTVVQAPFVHRTHISLAEFVVVYGLSIPLAGVLLQPFSVAVNTILYYDLRFRREGFDPWLEYDASVESVP